jgi:6-phosphofructokinase
MAKTIGVLTGGGDVPGLNPTIRALTMAALYEGWRVVGIRRGWRGLVAAIPEPNADNSRHFRELRYDDVRSVDRTGGTFLHSSRTNPQNVREKEMPDHLRSRYDSIPADVTDHVLKVLEFAGIDALVPIGGDDTLSFAARLDREGYPTVAIPKTMDNDVFGTDYCIGFSTCVTRTVEMINRPAHLRGLA